MNFKGIPESTNYTDRTSAPWYDPNKMLAGVIIGMNRLIGSKKQAELDATTAARRANPIAPMTPEEEQANYNAKVSRSPDGRGWTAQIPGKVFDEYIPDVVDPATIQHVLKQAGITK